MLSEDLDDLGSLLGLPAYAADDEVCEYTATCCCPFHPILLPMCRSSLMSCYI
jgi:hypothetical protein